MSTPLDCTFPPHIQSDLNALHSIHVHLCILSEDYSDHPTVRNPLDEASGIVLDAIWALRKLIPNETEEGRSP